MIPKRIQSKMSAMIISKDLPKKPTIGQLRLSLLFCRFKTLCSYAATCLSSCSMRYEKSMSGRSDAHSGNDRWQIFLNKSVFPAVDIPLKLCLSISQFICIGSITICSRECPSIRHSTCDDEMILLLSDIAGYLIPGSVFN